MHADHVTLTRLFVAAAVAQIAVGLYALVKGAAASPPATMVVGVSVGAVVAWAVTRASGASRDRRPRGVAEAAQFADSVCAALAAVAAVAAVVWPWPGAATAVSAVRLGAPAMAVGVVAVAPMLTGTNHADSGAEAPAGHTHAAEAVSVDGGVSADAAAVEASEHPHTDAATDADHEAHRSSGRSRPAARSSPWPGTGDTVDVQAAVWPRRVPARPQPVDLSGVPGVTPEQELKAVALVQPHPRAAAPVRRRSLTIAVRSGSRRSAMPAPAARA